jgi:hypothetical protein
MGDAFPHLHIIFQAEKKIISTGWGSGPGLLQSRFRNISVNNSFAGRHWAALQKPFSRNEQP